MSIAANTASAAEDEIAWLMPETCRIWVARMRPSGRSASLIRLAPYGRRR
jgi:hypothetical protein